MIIMIILTVFPAIGSVYMLTHGHIFFGAIGGVGTLVWWGYLYSSFTSTSDNTVYERAHEAYLQEFASRNNQYLNLVEETRCLPYGTYEYERARLTAAEYKMNFDHWVENEHERLARIEANILNNIVKHTRD